MWRGGTLAEARGALPAELQDACPGRIRTDDILAERSNPPLRRATLMDTKGGMAWGAMGSFTDLQSGLCAREGPFAVRGHAPDP
jgi:hypothetical protein